MARAPIYAVLTTYKRTEIAKRTIKALEKNMLYDGEWSWILVDDGSSKEHRDILQAAMVHPCDLVYNSKRKGVGHGMNTALRWIDNREGKLVLLMEDDWELREPTNFNPYADLLISNEDVGYVRMGYMSTGLELDVMSRDGALWLDVKQNSPYQYKYTGHAGLRHIRFYKSYGFFAEGIPPGATELDMCAKVNRKPSGPKIVIPLSFTTQWGLFNHIGGESLADVGPDK